MRPLRAVTLRRSRSAGHEQKYQSHQKHAGHQVIPLAVAHSVNRKIIMTAQIPLSQIGDADEFKKRVAAFRQAKLDHHARIGEPAPREHELVEACVKRVPRGEAPDDYVVEDYAIVDDRPSLRARKDALIHEVSREEHALMVASMPPGKRRLDGLTAGDLLRRPETERSTAETAFLAERDTRHVREDAIGRHAAQLMSDIEDLTDETIGAWKPAPFPSFSAVSRGGGPRGEG